MTRTIEVTINLTRSGAVTFDYYEPESGDSYRISAFLDTLCDEENRVGSEILSWVSLMADEMEEDE